MPKISRLALSLILVTVVAVTFATGYEIGHRNLPAAEGLDIVRQAWDLIYSDYVNTDNLDAKALSRGAIEGMIEALDDPYTAYLDPPAYKLGLSMLEGEFSGIGAQVGINNDRLTIIAPIAGSPAEKAGIRAGDVILEINGESTTQMNLAEAVLIIRGPQGTSVKLLILHLDETEPREIEIIRSKIELPSVRFEMKEDLAYINITQFSERTNGELIPALQSMLDQKATGIILDLRHNPGGLLDSVIDVASHFLQQGVVVSVVKNHEPLAVLEVKSGGVTTDLPIVVLTDNFSASGSEVLAGALQDHGRAIIAGSKTFGKGSVNILRQLDDGSGIYITTARWLTPNGHLIEGKGIVPDFELKLEGDTAVQWAIDYLKGHK